MEPLFEVRMFYNEHVAPPGEPNEMAVHTWNADLLSRDMEIQASVSRPDVGRVEWRHCTGDDLKWKDAREGAKDA